MLKKEVLTDLETALIESDILAVANRFCRSHSAYRERVTHLPPTVAAPSWEPRNIPDDCAFAIADVRLRPRRQPQSVRQAHWNALAIRTRPGFIPQENGRTRSAAEDGRR
jgi:hypothetical protein